MKQWILLANSCFAEIYSGNRAGIESIQYFDYPEGRQKSGEILTERPGRVHESQGSTSHAVGTKVDVHMHEIQMFAHIIAQALKKAKAENAFDRLVIIAPPQFLGELRPLLPDTIKKCIHKEINKDISPDLSVNERKQSVLHYLQEV